VACRLRILARRPPGLAVQARSTLPYAVAALVFLPGAASASDRARPRVTERILHVTRQAMRYHHRELRLSQRQQRRWVIGREGQGDPGTMRPSLTVPHG
jgi:hypothetical protein